MDLSSSFRNLISPAVARVLPFAVFIAFIMLQNLGVEWFQSVGWDARWLYPARTIVVGLLLIVLWRYYTELHTLSGITTRWMLIAVGSGIVVFVLWINLDFRWARLGTAVMFDPSSPDGSGLDYGLVFFRLAGLAVVVPVMEELFWRSFLLRWIDQHDFLKQDPARASLRAIVLSTLLFASAHTLWLASVIAALVYIVVYMRGGNLWLPIISHGVTNGVLGWWILATGNWQFW